MFNAFPDGRTPLPLHRTGRLCPKLQRGVLVQPPRSRTGKHAKIGTREQRRHQRGRVITLPVPQLVFATYPLVLVLDRLRSACRCRTDRAAVFIELGVPSVARGR